MRLGSSVLLAAALVLLPGTGRADLPPLRYLGFGDSFSSGEGTFFYDAVSAANGCHRSGSAYSAFVEAPGFPSLPIRDLANSGDWRFQWDFYACSGAVTKNVKTASSGGAGQKEDPPDDAPQIDQYQPVPSFPVAAITIGGNDVGFAYVLQKCFLKNDCEAFEPESGAPLGDWVRARMTALRPELATVYGDLRGISGAIFVLAYPRLFGAFTCDDLSRASGLFELSPEEQVFLNALGRDLNLVLSDVARQSNVHFVGNLDYFFADHRLCDLDPPDAYFNGILFDFPFRPRSESIHPNTLGHRAYADALNRFMRELADSGWYAPAPYRVPFNPVPESGSSASAARVAMASGAPPFSPVGELSLEHLTAPPCEMPRSVARGEAVRLQAGGFSAGETVTVRIEAVSDYSVVLATLPAGGAGTLDTTVTIPTNLPLDAPALLEATALGPGGSGRIAYATLGVGSSFAADGDADGAVDLCDVCPSVSNPAQADDDGDGRGDACDPCPDDAEDDVDRDGACADADVCPHSAQNDADGDGVCGDVDNCPQVANPPQTDTNFDGVGDACQPPPQCSDGVDNDGDGRVDWDGGPGDEDPDPGCGSPGKNSERAAGLPCDDAFDDDGDLLVDYPNDPGCRDPEFPREDPSCQDGLDNDGDGKVDFDGGDSALGGFATAVADPHCTWPYRQAEKTPGSCGLGHELAPALVALGWLSRCRRAGGAETVTLRLDACGPEAARGALAPTP